MKPRYIIIFFSGWLLLFGCDGSKKRPRVSKHRINKETRLESPKFNEKIKVGDSVFFNIKSKSADIDSVVVHINNITLKQQNNSFRIAPQIISVGQYPMNVSVYFNGKEEKHLSNLIVTARQAPDLYRYEIINSFPHNPEDYTQGLLINNGLVYESTGRNGFSYLKKKELKTGKTIQEVKLSDSYFGEGVTLHEDKLYQLTYKSGECFVYDLQLNKEQILRYEGEGWGICSYDRYLSTTDGSNKILFLNPNDLSIFRTIEVYDDQEKISNLNELEVMDNMIYANIYHEDIIVAIDPLTGEVRQKIDMSGLLQTNDKGSAQVDVLNGIAYDAKNKKIYVTGKLWPKMYEVVFRKK